MDRSFKIRREERSGRGGGRGDGPGRRMKRKGERKREREREREKGRERKGEKERERKGEKGDGERVRGETSRGPYKSTNLKVVQVLLSRTEAVKFKIRTVEAEEAFYFAGEVSEILENCASWHLA